MPKANTAEGDGNLVKTRVKSTGSAAHYARELVRVDDKDYPVDEDIELTQDQIKRLEDAGVKFEDPKEGNS